MTMKRAISNLPRIANADDATQWIIRLYAAALMLLFPLLFRNYYIDITGFKFTLLRDATRLALGCAVLTWLIGRAVKLVRRELSWNAPRLMCADWALLCFAAVSAVSCVVSASPLQSFHGRFQRYTGLHFMLLNAVLFLIISRGVGVWRVGLGALYISGLLASILAVLNFLGFDPLSMYKHLVLIEHEMFLSTIGNRNFFGAFVCLFLPMCMALAVFFPGRIGAAAGMVGAAVGFCAVLAGRSDLTYAGILMAFMVLLLLSLPDWARFRRLLLLCVTLVASLGVMRTLYARFAGQSLMMQPGLSPMLLTGGVAVYAYIPAVAALVALAVFWRRGVSRRVLAGAKQALVVLVGLALVAGVLGFVYFTAIDRETLLQTPWDNLRFSDDWGNWRGYIWSRSMEYYAGASVKHKLIGVGPDLFHAAMVPVYGKEMSEITGFTFDNAHNEYIQYLLTIGLLGLAAYFTLIGAQVRQLFRSMRARPLESALLLLPILAYATQAVFNLSQPSTTPLFFAFLALSLSIKRNEDTPNDRSSGSAHPHARQRSRLQHHPRNGARRFREES